VEGPPPNWESQWAPAEIRGAFASMQTAIPGVRFCEHLPRLAKLAGRLTIVRSMTHDDLDHRSACYLALTGHAHPMTRHEEHVANSLARQARHEQVADQLRDLISTKALLTGARLPTEAELARKFGAEATVNIEEVKSPQQRIARVRDIVGEALVVNTHTSARQLRGRVADLLIEVGLQPGHGALYPHEFSGGQRQRVAIARAMVLKPRLVVLDEPTSALDMSVQAQIVDLLQQLQHDHSLGYLFISHDLRVVRALAHRIVVLRNGRVVEHGPADEVLARPRHEYTRALMAAAFTLEADDSLVVEE